LELLALHDGGATTPPPLVLDRALGPAAADDIEVTEAPLFGHTQLVDVTVTLGGRSAGSPMGSTTTSHYLVRVGLAADELVCSFESDTRQYGAESSSGWDGRLRKLRDAPLTFDLVQTFARAQMGGGSGWMDPGPKKTRYVVPERGVCSAAVEVAPRLIGIGNLGQPKKRR
jgi:hypothetical protein